MLYLHIYIGGNSSLKHNKTIWKGRDGVEKSTIQCDPSLLKGKDFRKI